MGIMYKLLKHRHSSDGRDLHYGHRTHTRAHMPGAVGHTMDLSQAAQWSGESAKVGSKWQQQQQKQRIITLDGEILTAAGAGSAAGVEQQHSPPHLRAECLAEEEDVEEDVAHKEFSAEHILQLCRFLAERAKKNKNLCNPAALQQPRAEQPATARRGGGGSAAEVRASPNVACEATGRRSRSALTPSTVLMDKLAIGQRLGHTRSHLSGLSGNAGCPQSASGGKRDILLKIRRQIFERKRQRQLAHVQQRYGIGAAIDAAGGAVWRPW